mgnify:CR=1 FL=1
MIDIRTHLDKFKENAVHSDSFLFARTLEGCDYCRRPKQAVSIIEDDSVCEDCIDKLEALTDVPHSAINSRPLYTPQHSDTNNDLAKVRLYTLNMIDLMSQDIQDIQEDDKAYQLIMLYKDIVNRLPPNYNILYTATKRLYTISENNYLHISIIIASRSVVGVALKEGIISGHDADIMYLELSELYDANLGH